jgi:hypothetical protein
MTDVFGKESGSADPVYGYADPDTCVIIGCVFGILNGGLKDIFLISVCRLTIPAERFGAQVPYVISSFISTLPVGIVV